MANLGRDLDDLRHTVDDELASHETWSLTSAISRSEPVDSSKCAVRVAAVTEPDDASTSASRTSRSPTPRVVQVSLIPKLSVTTSASSRSVGGRSRGSLHRAQVAQLADECVRLALARTVAFGTGAYDDDRVPLESGAPAMGSPLRVLSLYRDQSVDVGVP